MRIYEEPAMSSAQMHQTNTEIESSECHLDFFTMTTEKSCVYLSLLNNTYIISAGVNNDNSSIPALKTSINQALSTSNPETLAINTNNTLDCNPTTLLNEIAADSLPIKTTTFNTIPYHIRSVIDEIDEVSTDNWDYPDTVQTEIDSDRFPVYDIHIDGSYITPRENRTERAGYGYSIRRDNNIIMFKCDWLPDCKSSVEAEFKAAEKAINDLVKLCVESGSTINRPYVNIITDNCELARALSIDTTKILPNKQQVRDSYSNICQTADSCNSLGVSLKNRQTVSLSDALATASKNSKMKPILSTLTPNKHASF